MEDARREVIPHLTGNPEGKVVTGWLDEAVDLFVHFAKPEVRLLFLKQFRSAEDPTRACYQAVVEDPVRLTEFLGGGRLHHPYRISLNPALAEQYPIAQRLGLRQREGGLDASFGFWSEASFTIENGTTVWEWRPSATAPPPGCLPTLLRRFGR